MKRYAKFGYAAPFRFRVILEKPQGGQNDPPPARRLTLAITLTIKWIKTGEFHILWNFTRTISRCDFPFTVFNS